MIPRRDRGDPPPPARPQRWHWLVTTGTGLGAIAMEIANQGLANLAALTGPTYVVGTVSGIVLLALGVLDRRGRRAKERMEAVAPPPAIRALPLAKTIVDLPPAPQPVIRQSEVARLAEAIAVEGAAVLLVGRAGVGTSTCAVQAANLARRPEVPGPWYLDLNPGGQPLPPRNVVAAVEDKLASRGLIVLDNAASARQVKPLLREPRSCRLLIAGGPALEGLQRVNRHRLSEPSRQEAAALFRSVGPAGPPGLADQAVTALVDICGRQPYAVRALAYWIVARGWQPDAVQAALEAEVARDVWHQGRQSATIALLLEWDLAYWELRPEARRLFRLLALVAYPLPRDAVAALAGNSGRVTDRLLAELATAECVDSDPGERYLIRPLLVPFARLHLRFEEPPRRRVAALTRTLRYFAQYAEQRAAGRNRTDWFSRHRPLLDALTGRDEAAAVAPPYPPARMRRWRFRLSVAMATWYASTGQLDDWAATCKAVLATQPPVPRSMAAWAYNELGVALRRKGDPAAAERELHQAAALRSRRGVAQNRTNLGLALLDRDDLDNAIEQLQISVRHRSRSDRAGKARSRLGLGVALLAAGHTAAARRQLVLAANGFRAVDDLTGYGAALSNLILVQWSLGEYLDAAQARDPALECLRATGDRSALAAGLLNAAATLISGEVKDPATAHQLLAESLELRAGLPDGPGTGRCHLYLGDVLLELGEPARAAAHWSMAHRICLTVGDAAGAMAADARRQPGDGTADAPPA